MPAVSTDSQYALMRKLAPIKTNKRVIYRDVIAYNAFTIPFCFRINWILVVEKRIYSNKKYSVLSKRFSKKWGRKIV